MQTKPINLCQIFAQAFKEANLNVTACHCGGREPQNCLTTFIQTSQNQSSVIPNLVYDLHCCRTQNTEVSSQKNLYCPWTRLIHFKSPLLLSLIEMAFRVFSPCLPITYVVLYAVKSKSHFSFFKKTSQTLIFYRLFLFFFILVISNYRKIKKKPVLLLI